MNHDIKYNSKKSIVFACKSKYMKNVDVPSFKINGETIKEVDHVKYLGHFIFNTLRDDMDILRQCRQLYDRGNMLLRKLHVFYRIEYGRLHNLRHNEKYTLRPGDDVCDKQWRHSAEPG